jgi:hypothetical protein
MPLRKLLFCITLSLLSQLLHAQFTIGVAAGINLANTKEDQGRKISNFVLPRPYAGIDLGYFFNDHWGVQTGAYYSGKGFRTRVGDNVDSMIVRLNYAEVPVKLTYRIRANMDNWVLINAGIYNAYGMNGKTVVEESPEPNKDPFTDPGLKRYDMGYLLESAFGIKNNFAAKLNYTHGLTSISEEDKIKNFAFGFSFVYLIR